MVVVSLFSGWERRGELVACQNPIERLYHY